MAPTKVWLDCDPGRDDAVAILLCLHLPEIELLGISAVHGNAGIYYTTYNAVRILCSFASDEDSERIPVLQGARGPLLHFKPSLEKGSVHGADGLSGVLNLLDKSDPKVARKLEAALAGNAIEGMAAALRGLPEGEKLTLIATGAMTDMALLVATYPDLVLEKVESIVMMGGAEGRGNKTPVAEANVNSDPEAASIVFDFPIKTVIAPLNCTHQALILNEIHSTILDPAPATPYTATSPLPAPASRLRHCISTNIIHYAQAYKEKYDFPGPPIHDALTVAYVTHPHLFEGKRYRVDVETKGTHSYGSTIVDLWDYKHVLIDQDESNWGPDGYNVFVLETVKPEGFWPLLYQALAEADKVCPINKTA